MLYLKYPYLVFLLTVVSNSLFRHAFTHCLWFDSISFFGGEGGEESFKAENYSLTQTIAFNNNVLINISLTLVLHLPLRYMPAQFTLIHTSGFFLKCHHLFFSFKSENSFNFNNNLLINISLTLGLHLPLRYMPTQFTSIHNQDFS